MWRVLYAMISRAMDAYPARDPVRDPEIVRAAQSGDAEALEAFLTALANDLLPLAAALTGDKREADELLGDTLSLLYERLGQLREPKAANAWAQRALVRRFRDGRRRLSRQRSVPIETVVAATRDTARPELIDLRMAVRRLSRDDRALLTLHYWQGYSISECANELDIPEGTAKSRLNKALGRLRTSLKEGHR